MDVCKLLYVGHTLVMVRLDYCNALLCGAREDVIRQLERLQMQAAIVKWKKYKNVHKSDRINVGSAALAANTCTNLAQNTAPCLQGVHWWLSNISG